MSTQWRRWTRFWGDGERSRPRRGTSPAATPAPAPPSTTPTSTTIPSSTPASSATAHSTTTPSAASSSCTYHPLNPTSRLGCTQGVRRIAWLKQREAMRSSEIRMLVVAQVWSDGELDLDTCAQLHYHQISFSKSICCCDSVFILLPSEEFYWWCLRRRVYALNVVGQIPAELEKLTHLANLYGA